MTHVSRPAGAIRLDEASRFTQSARETRMAVASDSSIVDEEIFYVELICRFYRVSEYLKSDRAALDVGFAKECH